MSLSKDATLTFGTKILSFIFSFIGSIFITRLLGVEGKGIQAFINANVSLFSMILGLNILQTLTYFIAKKNFDKAAARGFALILNVTSIIIFTGFTFLLFYIDSPILNLILPQEYQTLFFYYYLVILFINYITTPYFHGNWQGSAKFNIINYITILSSILNAVIFAGAWSYSKFSQNTLSLERVFSISLGITIFLFLIRISIFIKFKTPINFNIKKVMKPMLLFTGVGWLIGILNFAVKRIDIWFVEYNRGIEQLGFYALATGVIDILITLILPATFVISPYLTTANNKRKEEILGRFSRIAFLLLFLFSILGLPTIKFFIPIIYGSEFTQSIMPFQILFIGGMMIILRNIFGVYNIATNNLRPNLYATFLAFIITIILDYLWVPKYGIIGASWASLIAYLVSSFIIIVSVLKKLNNRTSYFFLFRKTDYLYLNNKLTKSFKK